MQNYLGQISIKLMEQNVMERERRGFPPSLRQTQSEELWVIIPHVYWGLRAGLTSAHRGLSLHHSALSVTSASARERRLTLPKTWRRYGASFFFRTGGRWWANINTHTSSPLLLSPFILFSQTCFFIPTPADTAAGPSGWTPTRRILICMWVLVSPTARI